jgi:dipeptidyl aminopeptidase/acylaminoacyl peptidase
MRKLNWPPSIFMMNGVLTAGGRFYSPGPPSWSPDGQWLSYVWTRNGINQIWLQAENSSLPYPVSKHPVVAEATDGTDRRNIGGGPQWSPDSTRVAYVGVNPHAPSQTSIFVAEIDSGKTHQLTNHPGSDRTPRWSPDGRWIAFVVDWGAGGEQISIVPAHGGIPIQLTIDRHANTDIVWSPDSQFLAFSTQRSDHHRFAAAIAIVRLRDGRITVVEHEEGANERMPHFAPDAQQLAFVSDRDGIDSLWIYNLSQKSLRKVDVGWGEVAHPKWDPNGNRIAFIRTNGFSSRLGCVELSEDLVTWWSAKTGSAFWPSWSRDGTKVAYAWSDSVHPLEIWVIDTTAGSGWQATHTAPKQIPYSKLVSAERLTYAGHDGLEIDALLLRPSDKKKTGGGILYVHGGPNALTREVFDPLLQYLVVEEGYTILAPNVRGSTGYGREFMEMNYGDYGGKDQLDWLAGIDTLVNVGGVDVERIAIWGRSYGGFATMLSLCQYPNMFCCGIAQFGVSDWHLLWDHSIPWVRRLMSHQLGHPIQDRNLYKDRSPVEHVSNIKSPILLLHGDADKGVPIAQSLVFSDKLARQNSPYELHVYPGEGHGFDNPHHIIDVASVIIDFCQRHLK